MKDALKHILPRRTGRGTPVGNARAVRGVPSSFINPLRSLRVLAAAGGVLCLSALAAPVTNTTYNGVLTWDASPSAAITNYSLYWGPSSRTYTNSMMLGTSLTGTVTNLSEGVSYYFAVTCTDSNGRESGYSAEVWTNVPPAPVSPTNLRIKVIR